MIKCPRVEGLRHAAMSRLNAALVGYTPDTVMSPQKWNHLLSVRTLIDRAIRVPGGTWACRTAQQESVLREYNAAIIAAGLNPSLLNYWSKGSI